MSSKEKQKRMAAATDRQVQKMRLALSPRRFQILRLHRAMQEATQEAIHGATKGYTGHD